jgi:hypothetical protein
VRFVEVVVNGPKSWSLAAAVHPDVAAAYDAAQDRAAVEIIGWLTGHATTRIGPRGGQVQVPVDVLEAVTVRHYTSRAGDPHRRLHLQLNARVFAAGQWRGLHTVGVRDFLAATNGIGHAAVACDAQLRTALAAHGYTVDATGEILEFAEYVGPFSARAAQIGRNLDRYERDWAAAHPGESPGPALRRAWDARAWADGRPDKVIPRSGAEAAHAAGWAHERAQQVEDPPRDQLARSGGLDRTPDAAGRLADVDRDIAAAEYELAGARARIAGLVADPALLGQPADRLAAAHEDWRTRHAADPTSPALLRRGRPPLTLAFRDRSPSVAVRPSPGVAPPPASGDEPHRRLQTNWRIPAGSGGRLSPTDLDWRLLQVRGPAHRPHRSRP